MLQHLKHDLRVNDSSTAHGSAVKITADLEHVDLMSFTSCSVLACVPVHGCTETLDVIMCMNWVDACREHA